MADLENVWRGDQTGVGPQTRILYLLPFACAQSSSIAAFVTLNICARKKKEGRKEAKKERKEQRTKKKTRKERKKKEQRKE